MIEYESSIYSSLSTNTFKLSKILCTKYAMFQYISCTQDCLATADTISLKADHSVDFDTSTLSAMPLKLQKKF